MKYFLVMLFLSQALWAQEAKDLQHINSLIKDYFLKDEKAPFDMEKKPVYLAINMEQYNKFVNDQKYMFWQVMNYTMFRQRENLKNCTNNYKVVKHAAAPTKLVEAYRLNYENKSKVYYLLCNDKIITHFIFNDKGGIISFSPNPWNNNSRVEPLMLDNLEN